MKHQNIKKSINASFTFHCSNFRVLEVLFTLLLLSHYIRFTLRFLFLSRFDFKRSLKFTLSLFTAKRKEEIEKVLSLA